MAHGTAEDVDGDLEARKHLWRGLARMTPAQRVAFLDECCRGVAGPGGVGVRVEGHTGEVGEAYYDLALLAVSYGFDLYRACDMMERRLKSLGRGVTRWH